jgi:hypothetical protein
MPRSARSRALVGPRTAVGLFALALGCGAAEPPPPFAPLADTKLLMEAVVDPQADVIWLAVQTVLTEGEGGAVVREEIRPKTDEEWLAVRNSAINLAESGNLLMMAPRARDRGDWMKHAQALIETSTSAVKAAEEKNPDRLFEVGGHIYAACTGCHAQYIVATEQSPEAPR